MNIAKEKARPGDAVYFHRHVQAGACSKIMKFEARYLKKSSESLRGECCAKKVMGKSKDAGAGHRLFHIVSGTLSCRVWTGHLVFNQFLQRKSAT